jgi:hypothetical protein
VAEGVPAQAPVEAARAAAKTTVRRGRMWVSQKIGIDDRQTLAEFLPGCRRQVADRRVWRLMAARSAGRRKNRQPRGTRQISGFDD